MYLEAPLRAELMQSLLRIGKEVHEPGRDEHASREHVEDRQPRVAAGTFPARATDFISFGVQFSFQTARDDSSEKRILFNS